MAATIFSNASAAKPGMKVEVTQRIPSRVIRDGMSNTLSVRDIPRGTIGRVIDTRVGEVHVSFFFGSDGGMADHTFKDYDFEKYFGEWL